MFLQSSFFWMHCIWKIDLFCIVCGQYPTWCTFHNWVLPMWFATCRLWAWHACFWEPASFFNCDHMPCHAPACTQPPFCAALLDQHCHNKHPEADWFEQIGWCCCHFMWYLYQRPRGALLSLRLSDWAVKLIQAKSESRYLAVGEKHCQTNIQKPKW